MSGLRIGFHPNNLHLTLAALWPEAFPLAATFVPYAEGRDTARLLADGAIDLGGTGSTPPILAEAAGVPVIYVAASAPRPANGAILVRAGGPVGAVPDLAGRAVALVDGSFHAPLLATALERAGLRLADVARTETPPAASAEALLAGRVDAWVAMAPHLEAARADPRLRVLAGTEALIPNRSLFWARRDRLSPDVVADLAEALGVLGQALAANRGRAAQLLGRARVQGIDEAAWRPILEARDLSVGVAGKTVLREQRAEADLLERHGALPHRVGLGAGSRNRQATPEASAP